MTKRGLLRCLGLDRIAGGAREPRTFAVELVDQVLQPVIGLAIAVELKVLVSTMSAPASR